MKKLSLAFSLVFFLSIGLTSVDSPANEPGVSEPSISQACDGTDSSCVSEQPVAELTQLYLQKHAAADSIQHGTHLCTYDDDCGTDHKCCSGHCKRVDTCP